MEIGIFSADSSNGLKCTRGIVVLPVGSEMTDPRKNTGFVACKSAPLVYMNLPKSGCTTIKNLMHRIDSGEFLSDPLAIHGRRDLLVWAAVEPNAVFARLKTDVVFTFVRHPLRRAYSCFNEKIVATDGRNMPRARRLLKAQYGMTFPRAPTIEQHRRNFVRFLHMVRDSMTYKVKPDPHWLVIPPPINGLQK